MRCTAREGRIDAPEPRPQRCTRAPVIDRAPPLLKGHHFAAGEEIAVANGAARQAPIKSLSCRNPVGYRTMRGRDIGGHWPENATAWAEGRKGGKRGGSMSQASRQGAIYALGYTDQDRQRLPRQRAPLGRR